MAAVFTFVACEKEQTGGGKVQKPVTQIKDIQAAGTYNVLATVAAAAKNYYVITDGSANIAVYTADVALKIGDKVLVEGSVQRGKENKYNTDAWQFASPTCTVVSSDNQVAHSPVEYNGQMIEAALGGNCSCPEVSFKGKFYKNDTYYNIYIKGTSKQAGFYYQETGAWDAWDGKNVIVKAYLIQQYNYFNVVPYDVVEDENPEPFITSVSASELEFAGEGGSKELTVNVTSASGWELSATANNEAFTTSINGNVITVNATPAEAMINAVLTIELKADGKVVDNYEVTLSQSAPLADGYREVMIDFPAMGYANATEITEIKKDGLTMAFDKGDNSNGPKYYTSGTAVRLYGGNSVTITGGTISTVKLTLGSGEEYDNAINPSDGTFDVATGIWTGSTASLTLTIDGTKGHRRIQKMSIVYLPVEFGGEVVKTGRNLAFSKATVTTVLGEEFVAPTLSGSAEGVVYSSSDAEVATVDSATGAVTIVALGTTVITAAAEESETLLAGQASYTINVVEEIVLPDVPSGDVLADGKYWIVGTKDGVTRAMTPLGANGKNYGYAQSEELVNGVGFLENAFTFTAVSGGYTIMDNNGKYYYQEEGTEYKTFNIGSDATLDGCVWTVAKNPDNTFTIVNVASKKQILYGDGTYTSFGVYGESDENTGLPITLINASSAQIKPVFELAKTNATVNADVTTYSVALETNLAWTATASSGVTLDPASGNGSESVVMTFAANTGETALTHTVTFTAGDDTKTFTLTQRAPATGGEPGSSVTLSVTIEEIVKANNYTVSQGSTVTRYKELSLDEVISMVAGGTGSNEGSFWESGKEWRLYQSGDGQVTVSAASGYTIQSVKFTYSVSKTGTLKKDTEIVSSGTVDVVDASSVTYKVGNTGDVTNGQVRITAVEVVYQAN